MLPKLKPLPWACRPEGGLPPLAGGCGIGDGEVAGEVTRGLGGADTAKEDEEVATRGALWTMAGEVLVFIEPN